MSTPRQSRPRQSRAEGISAASALDDPVRRALYDLVARSVEPVGRETAAATLSLSRSTAAFHLDRLVGAGLLDVEFRRLSGRSGPGAGRPAKLYRRARTEILVSIPERHYDLAAEIMAEAIGEAVAGGEGVQSELRRVAGRTGRRMAELSGGLEAALELNGFEPRREGCGSIVLGTCPFDRLAIANTDVVCALNLELITGMADGSNDTQHTVVADANAGACCVRAVPRATAAPAPRI